MRAGGTQATSRPERERRPSPSAPAKNSATAFAVALFFVMAVGESEARGACRGALVAGGDQRRPSRQARQVRPSISAMLWRSCPPFPCSIASFPIRPHPSSTSPTLSSTRNAPGFALFGLFRVRFSLFRCFSAAKFLSWFLCILSHSGYKLKPSVIPCRREVSFLT